MDDLIERLQGLTEQFVNRVDQVSPGEVMEFVEERELLVRDISGGGSILTDTQRRKIQAVLQLDPLIVNRMGALKDEASHELKKIRQSKMQHDLYDKAYAADSYFFDKKK